MAAIRKKMLVVGDGNTGKTCLLVVFTTGSFEQSYIPTVFDNYEGSITLDNTEISLSLWDSAGQEDYDSLRPLCYPDTDVILVCFAIDRRTSLQNVLLKWVPEIKSYCPEVPIVLIGNKKDVRDEPETFYDTEEIIKFHDGENIASKIEAIAYLECSAKTNEGVREVFVTATKAALSPKKKNTRKNRCILL